MANSKKSRSGSSKYKGVHWRKEGGWRAIIACNKKRKCLGTYKTEEEAARAYDKEALKCFGDFARLNFTRDKTRVAW